MSSSFRRAARPSPRSRPSSLTFSPHNNDNNNTTTDDPSSTRTLRSSSNNTFIRHDVTTSTSRPNANITNTSTSSTSSVRLERRGTKPWIGGQTLTSSGLRELDAILGGGQPMGTAILLKEDRWTQDLALAIVRCWSAEAASQKQQLSLVATKPDLKPSDLSTLDDLDTAATTTTTMTQVEGMTPKDGTAFLKLLPKDLHLEKARTKQQQKDKEDDNATNEMKEQENPSSSNSKKTGESSNDTNSTAISTERRPFDSIVEEGDEDEESDFEEGDEDHNKNNAATSTSSTSTDAEEGLTNAWQYKLSIQQQRLGTATPSKSSSSSSMLTQQKIYCHSYDLNGRMQDQYPSNHWNADTNDYVSILDFSPKATSTTHSSSPHQHRSYALQLYQNCISHIQTELNHPRNVDNILRMLLLNAPVDAMAITIPLLLTYIRTRSLPVVILLTIRPWYHQTLSSSSSLTSLQRVCDAVFTCEGFSAMTTPPPPEFSDLTGIFTIQKLALQSLHHFAESSSNRMGGSGRPQANRYGMKRDRRKVTIQMLHLPPEDFSAGGSSVGSGVRSGAGRQQPGQGGSSAGRRTALEPGLGCASHHRPSATTGSSSPSLDF